MESDSNIEEDRPATLTDFREEGRRNGLKAAEAFGRLCLGPDPAKLMPPDVWWRVHEEEVLPATLNKMRSAGASSEELDAYSSALNSELDQYCMNFAQLGLFGISLPGAQLSIDNVSESHSVSPLDQNSTLVSCSMLGAMHGKEEAIEDSLRAQYRGYELVGAERKKKAHKRVEDLYSRGLLEDQVTAYIDAAIKAATEVFEAAAIRTSC